MKNKKETIDTCNLFINAIINNNNNVINKSDCINKILKYKNEKNAVKKEKKKLSELIPKERPKHQKKIFRLIEEQLKEEEESKKLNEKILKENNENINNIKEIDQKNNEIEKINNENENSLEKKDNLIQKENNKQKKPTRRFYRCLKSVLKYLEMNSLTLDDYLHNNPFQTHPFSLPYSEDFFSAIKFKDYDFINKCLDNSYLYLFCFDYYKQTPYHWAAKLNDIKLLKILIEKGKFVNQKDNKGRIPLHFAALNNNYDCCKVLIDNFGDSFVYDCYGKRPIDYAEEERVKIYLTESLEQPYNNKLIRKKIQILFKKREEKINEKKNKFIDNIKKRNLENNFFNDNENIN